MSDMGEPEGLEGDGEGIVRKTSLTDKEKAQLLQDIYDKFHVQLSVGDPSLVAFYVYVQLFQQFQGSLNLIEKSRREELDNLRETTLNFKLSLNSSVERVIEEIFMLSDVKLTDSNRETQKKFQELTLTTVNVALKKISEAFDSEIKKMNEAIKKATARIERCVEPDRKGTRFIIFTGGILTGITAAVMVAGLVSFMMR